jgi:hypothetical protein
MLRALPTRQRGRRPQLQQARQQQQGSGKRFHHQRCFHLKVVKMLRVLGELSYSGVNENLKPASMAQEEEQQD